MVHSRPRLRYVAPLLSAAIAVLLAAGAPVAAEPLFEKLVGEWVGKGTGIQRAGAPTERVYCRINNEIARPGAVLKQSGRCAFGNDTGALSGQFRALGGGHYDGAMTSPMVRGTAVITGRGSDARLNLKAVYEDSKTGRPTKSVVSLIVIEDGKYRLMTKASDLATGAPVQSSELLFVRQKTR